MKIPPKKDSAILQWIDSNRFKTSGGIPFDWARHSFLIDPMCDWSLRIAIRKSAQIGFSESFGLMKSLFASINYGANVIYTLPSDRSAEDFVTTKFNPICENNSNFGGLVDGSLSIKKVKNNFIYFMGTHNTKGSSNKADNVKGITVSSDINIHDERDRSDQFTIDQYSSRLENSDYGAIWSFSNPTIPGFGTDLLFENSDQKKWYVRCSHCNTWQYMDWVKVGEVSTDKDELHCLVDIEKEAFVCAKCSQVLSDTDRMRGEWVAKFPERETSGYWMSQMNYPRHRVGGPKGLLEKEKTQSKQVFLNFVLGKGYKGTDVTVDRGAIYRNIILTDNNKQNVAIGVDQGTIKTYVIGNRTGIFEIGTTKSWDDIEALRNKYNATMVMDALPNDTEPKKLVKKYPGKAFICYYAKDTDDMGMYYFMKGEDRGVVKVQRTKYFDYLVDKFAQREKPINLSIKELDTYSEHWDSLARQEIADSKGILRGEWISSNGKDHFAHATLYQDVAMKKLDLAVGAIYVPEVKEEEKGIPVIAVDDMGYTELLSIEKMIELNSQGEIDWRYT